MSDPQERRGVGLSPPPRRILSTLSTPLCPLFSTHSLNHSRPFLSPAASPPASTSRQPHDSTRRPPHLFPVSTDLWGACSVLRDRAGRTQRASWNTRGCWIRSRSGQILAGDVADGSKARRPDLQHHSSGQETRTLEHRGWRSREAACSEGDGLLRWPPATARAPAGAGGHSRTRSGEGRPLGRPGTTAGRGARGGQQAGDQTWGYGHTGSGEEQRAGEDAPVTSASPSSQQRLPRTDPA